MDGSAHTDRRFFKRFLTPENAILFNTTDIFRLLDVSEGGLSFRCFQDEALPTVWTANIFLSSPLKRIKNIPLQLVWEKRDTFPSFLSKPTKEVGVMFCKMNEEHKLQLDTFLLDLEGLKA